MWYMTGSIKFGAAFGVAEIVLKPIIYYFHERIWYRRIKFGLVEEKKHKLKKVQLNEVETKVLDEVPQTNIVEPTGKKVLSYSSNR